MSTDLEGLLRDTLALASADRELTAPLTDRVVRPLSLLLGDAAPSAHVPEIGALALAATKIRSQAGASTLLIEATAALQDLACERRPELRDELAALQAGLPASIRTMTDGPYLVTNAPRLTSWLGEDLSARPQMALCRCGASRSKPLCDGSHAGTSFRGNKAPDRQPDRRDAYEGFSLTVLDNRSTCAHSGFCTERVPGAFHADTEPFATPSGARMDEIVSAVRQCPSGALSFAVDGHDAREQVDSKRPPSIEVSKDGPYRVTGGLALLDPEGGDEPRNQGASREHYSLCRCGRSKNKPFCSGMHWTVQFKDPRPPEDPTLFDWVGGLPSLTRMTRIFYGKYVPEEPLLRGLFATMSPDHPERVAAWLGETFGGPKIYSERHGGYDHMVSQHRNKAITEAQRSRWAQLLYRSADDAGLPADPEFRAAFAAYIEWGSRIALENSKPGAKPPAHMPVPRWWWVCEARPGSRISALATDAEDEVALPDEHVPLRFDQHIKPLFRAMDRNSMRFAFDLWSYPDVKKHGAAILGRLEAGTMPCDGAWPEEKLEVMRRWLRAGAPE